MIISIIISYWDLFFVKGSKVNRFKIKLIRRPVQIFYLSLFIAFGILYLYLYFVSLCGKYPKLPGIGQDIVDTAFFSVNTKKLRE